MDPKRDGLQKKPSKNHNLPLQGSTFGIHMGKSSPLKGEIHGEKSGTLGMVP